MNLQGLGEPSGGQAVSGERKADSVRVHLGAHLGSGESGFTVRLAHYRKAGSFINSQC